MVSQHMHGMHGRAFLRAAQGVDDKLSILRPTHGNGVQMAVTGGETEILRSELAEAHISGVAFFQLFMQLVNVKICVIDRSRALCGNHIRPGAIDGFTVQGQPIADSLQFPNRIRVEGAIRLRPHIQQQVSVLGHDVT